MGFSGALFLGFNNQVDRDYFHDNAPGVGNAQLLNRRQYRIASGKGERG